MKYLIILAILALVAISLCVTTSSQQGYVIVGIKDKQINNENITAISLAINSVQVHFSGIEENEAIDNSTESENNDTEVEESNETDIENNTAGWMTIFEGSKSFNLLDYTGSFVGVLGNTSLASGKYNQIRLYILNAAIAVDNTTYPLTTPSNVLKIVGGFEVEPNTTLVLVLDFDVEHSILKNANGYKLKPVIKLEKFKSNNTNLGDVGNDIGRNLEEIED